MFIDKIRSLNGTFHCTITGGGTEFISKVAAAGGNSDWFSGANIPYNPGFTEQWLGHKPEHYVTEEVAKQLAHWSDVGLMVIMPAETITQDNAEIRNTIGVRITLGVTAALTKKDQREGRNNHAWLCLLFKNDQTNARYEYTEYVKFDSTLSREKQEKLLVKNIENFINKSLAQVEIGELCKSI